MTAVPEPLPDPPAGPDPDLPGYLPTDFDWGLTGLATPLAMVRSQAEFSWFELRGRLARLTDGEFSWEPAFGALAVGPRGQTRTPRAGRSGSWCCRICSRPSTGKRRREPLQRQMRPVSWAHMATSTRFRAPSFRMRLARWALTVLGVM